MSDWKDWTVTFEYFATGEGMTWGVLLYAGTHEQLKRHIEHLWGQFFMAYELCEIKEGWDFEHPLIPPMAKGRLKDPDGHKTFSATLHENYS